jgi:putative SOS response-associated peptidase YedK
MCGRFVLVTDLSAVAQSFGVADVSFHFLPDRNIHPGRHIPAVIRTGQGNMLASFLWGLVPFWAKDPSIGAKLINARAETIAQKPAFQNAFRKRRCLIPADGFYEWKKEGMSRKPFLFGLKSGAPFVFAGLYERWTVAGQKPLDTCTIITTRANEAVAAVHDRMPVIVPKAGRDLWLNPELQDPALLAGVLKPYPAEEMVSEPADI